VASHWTRPRLAASCTLPRAGTANTCTVCHGPAADGYRCCWSCSVVARRLRVSTAPRLPGCDAPIAPIRRPPVVPITLFRPGSPIHRALVGYKSGHEAAERAALARDVVDLIGLFLARHSRCIANVAGGGWDRIEIVPSTRRLGVPHPLARALGCSPLLARREARVLRLGKTPLDHLAPAATAFTADGGPGRVLLLDDVFTTGAHAFSAARALQLSGIEVVAIVPVGRVVHTDDERSRCWWEAAFHPGSADEWSSAACSATSPHCRSPVCRVGSESGQQELAQPARADREPHRPEQEEVAGMAEHRP
jgi:predicted amidophosphoribosyltransferase